MWCVQISTHIRCYSRNWWEFSLAFIRYWHFSWEFFCISALRVSALMRDDVDEEVGIAAAVTLTPLLMAWHETTIMMNGWCAVYRVWYRFSINMCNRGNPWKSEGRWWCNEWLNERLNGWIAGMNIKYKNIPWGKLKWCTRKHTISVSP